MDEFLLGLRQELLYEEDLLFVPLFLVTFPFCYPPLAILHVYLHLYPRVFGSAGDFLASLTVLHTSFSF